MSKYKVFDDVSGEILYQSYYLQDCIEWIQFMGYRLKGDYYIQLGKK